MRTIDKGAIARAVGAALDAVGAEYEADTKTGCYPDTPGNFYTLLCTVFGTLLISTVEQMNEATGQSKSPHEVLTSVAQYLAQERVHTTAAPMGVVINLQARS